MRYRYRSFPESCSQSSLLSTAFAHGARSYTAIVEHTGVEPSSHILVLFIIENACDD